MLYSNGGQQAILITTSVASSLAIRWDYILVVSFNDWKYYGCKTCCGNLQTYFSEIRIIKSNNISKGISASVSWHVQTNSVNFQDMTTLQL